MKITQDVRDYTETLSDNEKADLEEQAKEGMAGMSEKFKQMGGDSNALHEDLLKELEQATGKTDRGI